MFQFLLGPIRVLTLIISFSYSGFAAEPSNHPDRVAKLLMGRGDVKLQLSSSTSYEVFFPENHPELNKLINLLHADLLTTPYGQKIISQALKCDPLLIQSQLGLQPDTVAHLTAQCSSQKSKPTLTEGGRRPDRLFAFLVSEQAIEPFESWSEPHRNRTVVLLTKKQLTNPPQIKEFLYRVLAHEMAIVLDGKSWPFGAAWERDSQLMHLTILAKDPQASTIAALNPLINTTLSLVRAFKVENELLKDLPNPPVDESGSATYRSCINTCLEFKLEEHSSWLINLSVPLLVWSPHYRAHRLAQLSQHDSTIVNEVQSHIAEHILKHGAEASLLQLLLSAKVPPPPAIRHLLFNRLLPEDLHALSDALVVERSGKTSSLLNFLAEPYLTPDGNILAHGPRPRIRGGYTR